MTTLRAATRRTVPAAAVLLLAYIGLSLLNDPRGYLGTDTGGKVATLQAMDRRSSLDPDVGYWAERWDPEGRFHPLYYTSHLAGKWVNVTTLPALYIADPLFRLGGYRGALLVPMAGSVLAALAARALARRLGAGEPQEWAAFWIVGLASPLTIYALDFWEHSLGVGLMAWAVVFLFDMAFERRGRLVSNPTRRADASRTGREVAGQAAESFGCEAGDPFAHQPPRPWLPCIGAGLLFGLAATMRTEALVYGAVATASALVVLLWRRRKLAATVAAGLAVVAGLAAPLAANGYLERATIGTSLRAERAVGTVQEASTAGSQSRAEEAALTFLAIDAVNEASSYLIGGVLLLLLVVLARRSAREGGDPRLVRLVFAGVVALYLIRFIRGLGFVPGLVAATPLAAFGLAWAWHDARSRLVAVVAVLALPVVWGLQYTGGAGPQWAGRYVLVSGLLLAVIGVVSLVRVERWVAIAMVVLSASVTAFGVTWLAQRSHHVAHAGMDLVARPEPVLISRVAHLWRELGSFADGHRWLTALTDQQVEEAVAIVGQAGFDRFGLVTLDDGSPSPPVLGYVATGADRVRFMEGDPLLVTTYVRGS